MNSEFSYIEKWLRDDQNKFKKGIDVGCGTNRLSLEVLSVDQNPHREFAHADVVHNCIDLEIKEEKVFNDVVYKFEDEEFDFIFSSHCLEDFENIPDVFMKWWKKIKKDGLMILLLPDMEQCDCELCMSDQQKQFRIDQNQSARYWTIEDYKNNKKGNPSHRTNVGKKFMTDMLQSFKEKNKLDYEMLQMDTIPHNQSCSIDFVIKKLN